MLKTLYKTHHCNINLAGGQSLARILLSLLVMVPENHFNVRKMYAKDHFGLFSASNTTFGNLFIVFRAVLSAIRSIRPTLTH